MGQHVSNLKVINQNLVAVMKKPDIIVMRKPLAVGFAILELSKLYMYRSYDKFKRYFGRENLRLYFSDTDSFLFQVKCRNLIQKLKRIEHMFDFSKYDKDHELFDDSRANHLFYFKDELKGKAAITEFIGLRRKCYSMTVKDLKTSGASMKKICKGLKKTSIKNHLTFDDYKKCLNESVLVYKPLVSIKSKNHRISTTYQQKIALSAMDTKRYVLSCGKCTLALGSCHIKKCSIGIEQLFYRSYPGVNPNQSMFLIDRFITGLVSPQVKEKLRIPPQPTNFREAVNSAMAYTAAIFPEHQTFRQKSLAWKMAATASHPLLTKSLHGNSRGSIQSIQMIDTPEKDHVSIQALKQWCALHKSDKHSDADCRAQQEATPTSTKKRPTTAKKGSKPRRLRFKTASDKKKFLRSVEGLEGVSVEDGSDDDKVVEQSLMQLQSPSEETDEEADDTLLDLHILAIQPTPLPDNDIVMEDDESLIANQELDPCCKYR